MIYFLIVHAFIYMVSMCSVGPKDMDAPAHFE